MSYKGAAKSRSWRIKSARSYAGERNISFEKAYTKLFGKQSYEELVGIRKRKVAKPSKKSQRFLRITPRMPRLR